MAKNRAAENLVEIIMKLITIDGFFSHFAKSGGKGGRIPIQATAMRRAIVEAI
jgi:hypothetical protein